MIFRKERDLQRIELKRGRPGLFVGVGRASEEPPIIVPDANRFMMIKINAHVNARRLGRFQCVQGNSLDKMERR